MLLRPEFIHRAIDIVYIIYMRRCREKERTSLQKLVRDRANVSADYWQVLPNSRLSLDSLSICERKFSKIRVGVYFAKIDK